MEEATVLFRKLTTLFAGLLVVVMSAGNVTTPAQAVETITYSANGAVNGFAPASVSANAGEPVVLENNSGAMTKTRFQFKGWNTQADGLGTHFDAGQTTIMPAGGLSLFAEWGAPPV